jgi:hypothetical protein
MVAAAAALLPTNDCHAGSSRRALCPRARAQPPQPAPLSSALREPQALVMRPKTLAMHAHALVVRRGARYAGSQTTPSRAEGTFQSMRASGPAARLGLGAYGGKWSRLRGERAHASTTLPPSCARAALARWPARPAPQPRWLGHWPWPLGCQGLGRSNLEPGAPLGAPCAAQLAAYLCRAEAALLPTLAGQCCGSWRPGRKAQANDLGRSR